MVCFIRKANARMNEDSIIEVWASAETLIGKIDGIKDFVEIVGRKHVKVYLYVRRAQSPLINEM
jgi:hypothetical protein